jgi:hypothetical protein
MTKVAGLCALIGTGRILLSDGILVLLPLDPDAMTVLQSYKGMFFAIVTSGLLALTPCGLLRRWEDEVEARQLSGEMVRPGLAPPVIVRNMSVEPDQ